jgi:hypothetical protein
LRLIQTGLPVSLQNLLNVTRNAGDYLEPQPGGPDMQIRAQSPADQGAHPFAMDNQQAFPGRQLRRAELLGFSSLRGGGENQHAGAPVQDWRHPAAEYRDGDHVISLKRCIPMRN